MLIRKDDMVRPTSNGKTDRSGALGVAVFELTAIGGVPNKPMVPTAPTSPNTYPLDSLRRHIGRPLGSRNEQRATSIPNRARNASAHKPRDLGTRLVLLDAD